VPPGGTIVCNDGYLSPKMRVARLSCSQSACDWMTGRKRSHSDSTQLTDK